MKKFFFILIQLSILTAIVIWLVNNSYIISVNYNDLILSTSTSFVILTLLFIIFFILMIQRIIYSGKQKFFKFKINREIKNKHRGYQAFTEGMIALSNKDFKKALVESQKASRYLQDKTLNLLLKSETLKIQKKYNELEKVYEEMINNQSTELLGLRGLMKQFLYAQDYHHAFIYGEKLFLKNHNIDKLYDTLINIIGKTNNWQKLLEINDRALKNKLISKDVYSINKSIAFFEISKIKKDSHSEEAINLIEKSLKLRQYFAPYVSYYISLLIENNKLSLAKKYIVKAWNFSSHPDYKNEIKKLSEKLKIPFENLVIDIIANSKNSYDSKILLTSSFIESKKWLEAKKSLSSLLEHKPSKEVCILMSIIEKGDSNDPQKINAWISRSNFGELNKIWICQINKTSQEEWTSVSNSGYFNSLEWKKPELFKNIISSNVETNLIEYIDN